jgi:hypothetical protein
VKKRDVLSVAVLALITVSPHLARAQQEGLVDTQALVTVEPKSTPPANAADLTAIVDNRKEPVTAWTHVLPAGAQVALLIDDGLRTSVGRELGSLRAFVQGLPPGIEVFIGYMQNGRVVGAQPFTADHALAASTLHLPTGLADASASPYFCLSDFVKHWPEADNAMQLGASGTRKARFVLMITNGVDPYNGSTSVLNQDSPYVASAVEDAQRAGVSVSSIYYNDAGFRGRASNFSGQSYLGQLSSATGGEAYYEGMGNPVSMEPFLTEFEQAIARTYVATFEAPAGKELARLKFTSQSKAKLQAPTLVRAGNQEASAR